MGRDNAASAAAHAAGDDLFSMMAAAASSGAGLNLTRDALRSAITSTDGRGNLTRILASLVLRQAAADGAADADGGAAPLFKYDRDGEIVDYRGQPCPGTDGATIDQQRVSVLVSVVREKVHFKRLAVEKCSANDSVCITERVCTH